MYSGTTFTPLSGKLLGAHQKIDRLAFNQLSTLKKEAHFPAIKEILHFEGYNGPDAIKWKSPARDEPWHFFRPYDMQDTELLDIISSHYKRLVVSLRSKDHVRASFEAAWLAHAVVDGLTPAHHFPFAEKISELNGGKGNAGRRSIKQKLFLPGTSFFEQSKNNWKFWGPKGLMITHASFEYGVAMLLLPFRQKQCSTAATIAATAPTDFKDWYRQTAQSVADLEIYDRYYQKGWHRPLAKDITNFLLPTIIAAVVSCWYWAASEAQVA